MWQFFLIFLLKAKIMSGKRIILLKPELKFWFVELFADVIRSDKRGKFWSSFLGSSRVVGRRPTIRRFSFGWQPTKLVSCHFRLRNTFSYAPTFSKRKGASVVYTKYRFFLWHQRHKEKSLRFAPRKKEMPCFFKNPFWKKGSWLPKTFTFCHSELRF